VISPAPNYPALIRRELALNSCGTQRHGLFGAGQAGFMRPIEECCRPFDLCGIRQRNVRQAAGASFVRIIFLNQSHFFCFLSSTFCLSDSALYMRALFEHAVKKAGMAVSMAVNRGK
jgi:hypothetical protein